MNFRSLVLTVLLFASSCVSWGTASHAPYPDDWWKPVPPGEAAGWEVLPQDAGPGEVILSKRTELGIFSNFAATPFEYEGKRYASIEGFWQMMKYPEGPTDERLKNPPKPWPHTRDQVAAMTAFEAKAAGNKANELMKLMGIRWVTFKKEKIFPYAEPKGRFYELIRDAEVAKLEQNPEVRELLKKTGDLKLRPDHHQDEGSLPAWKYHEIWMELRSELNSVAP